MITPGQKITGRKVIVVLEGCTVEAAKTKRGNILLNCDDHYKLVNKTGKDPADYRPDITHQCLLTLLDSPLNKSGHLQVYLHTKKNVLIEIDPRTRIPRTFKRFAGLMVQLLYEMKIVSVQQEGKKTLLRVIKNPITKHLPSGCRKIGTTCHVEPIDLPTYISGLPADEPVVWVIGGMAKGSIAVDYTEQQVSFSHYPLSASAACGRLCNAYEQLWGVL